MLTLTKNNLHETLCAVWKLKSKGPISNVRLTNPNLGSREKFKSNQDGSFILKGICNLVNKVLVPTNWTLAFKWINGSI